jgi:arsenate reductase
VEYEVRDIKTENPTYDELKKWLALSKLPAKKFFNTSGQLYKSLGLKDKLPSMSEDECLKLLATDGMLVKRPLLVDEDGVLVGFNHNEWESVVTEMVSVPSFVTIDITDNHINLPMEWTWSGNYGYDYTQITLVDDYIAIHTPTAVDVEYTKPCKAGDNSYIRSIDFLGVRVPKKFLEALGIREGDKADLTREDNCISIRKHLDEPVIPEPEPPEPMMSFCCVCGALRYTGQGIVKVLSKHICRECIEIVRAL